MKKKLFFFCFAFFFLVQVQSTTIVRGNPEWQTPQVSNQTLFAADQGKIKNSGDGCLIIQDKNTNVFKRCWIIQGNIGGIPFNIRSWQFSNWSFSTPNIVIGGANAISSLQLTSSVLGFFDLNFWVQSQPFQNSTIKFSGQNNFLPITNLRLSYVLLPIDLNSNWSTNWEPLNSHDFNFDNSQTIETPTSNDFYVKTGKYITTHFLDGDWTPTKLFVGKISDFNSVFSDSNTALIFQTTLGNGTISSLSGFSIGDTILRTGTISAAEDWNAGQTVDVNGSITLDCAPVGDNFTLTIHPQVCVKFADKTQLDATCQSVIVDGNSTNPVIFTSRDDNAATSGSFPCDNIGNSDGVPTDSNWTAILTDVNNYAFSNFKFFYADIGIQTRATTIGTALTINFANNDINFGSFRNGNYGIRFKTTVAKPNQSVKFLDFNTNIAGFLFDNTSAQNIGQMTDSNFTCKTNRGCLGIDGQVNAGALTIRTISNNRFDGVDSAFRIQATTGANKNHAITNFLKNKINDSNQGIYINWRSPNIITFSNFYENDCNSSNRCFDVNLTFSAGTRDGNFIITRFFNNTFRDSNQGFRGLFQGFSSSAKANFFLPDTNNNTFHNDSNAFRIEFIGTNTGFFSSGKFVQNNIFSTNTMGLNLISGSFSGTCRTNGWYANTTDYNGLTCTSDINVSSNPFDKGWLHSLYLNDDVNGGKKFRGPATSTRTDTNYSTRTTRASNIEDVSTTDLGAHFVVPDLNTQVLTPDGVFFAVRPTFTVDFNVGSVSSTSSDLTLDINISAANSQNEDLLASIIKTGATIVNDSNFTCDNSSLNPVTICHYRFGLFSSLKNDTNYWIKLQVFGNGKLAFDSVDNNSRLFNTHSVLVVKPNDFNWLTSNQKIDFNLNTISTAPSLKIDINFSTTNALGTGTSLLNDGNVASTPGLSCDNNVLLMVTSCRSPIDTTLVADGNYFVLVSIEDTNIGFDSSDNNIGVDNTVPAITIDHPVPTIVNSTNDINFRIIDLSLLTSTVVVRISGITSQGFGFDQNCSRSGNVYTCGFPEDTLVFGNSYILDINAQDIVGLVSSSSVSFAYGQIGSLPLGGGAPFSFQDLNVFFVDTGTKTVDLIIKNLSTMPIFVSVYYFIDGQNPLFSQNSLLVYDDFQIPIDFSQYSGSSLTAVVCNSQIGCKTIVKDISEIELQQNFLIDWFFHNWILVLGVGLIGFLVVKRIRK